MKNDLSTWCPPLTSVIRSPGKFIMILLLALGFSNCSYYKAKKSDLNDPPSTQEIQKLSPEEKYVIIHSGDQMVHLNNVNLDADNKELSGVLTQINSKHNNVRPKNNKTYRYNRREREPLNEVHFFTSEDLNLRIGEEVVLPFSILDSVSVNNRNTGRSVLNVAATTIAVLGVTIIVVALTKSSCPFIYVKDGEEFVFRGELYPGAITPNIQRDDYIPLGHVKEPGDEYFLKITNELHEIQYTDLLQLIVFEHPEDVQVLLDKDGNPQSFSNIEVPKKAFSDDLSGALPEILEEDMNSYLFDSESESNDGSRTLILEFTKPTGAKHAKLFLTAKNSLWLDYTFGKFNEKFGFYYNTFQKQQLKMPGEESMKWSKEQNIPLSIYQKTAEGWKLVERINTVGPLAYRDLVVPIDLADPVEENVVLKLETGFMFWEIDRAGIDFSENIDLKKIVLEPSFAVDEQGKNVTYLLRKADQEYLIQPEVGNEVVVSFRHKPGLTSNNTTAFLKNRGYYTYIRDYKGIPDFAELQSFKKRGRFSRFSEEQYKKFVAEDMLNLALTYGN